MQNAPILAETLTFDDAIKRLGLDLPTLRVEALLAASMNNRLINLNCRGLTWAGKILAPYDAASAAAFVTQKARAIRVGNYLSDRFASGVTLSETERFVFDQRAYLVDGASTRLFLERQSALPSVVIDDQVRGVLQERRGVEVTWQPTTPCLAQRGAPAKETLEDGSQFIDLSLRGLAALHASTGLTALPPLNWLATAVRSVESVFSSAGDVWEAENEKERRKIATYAARYVADNDIGRLRSAKHEVFLQTTGGDATLRRCIRDVVNADFLNAKEFRAFAHGDAHGGNFIFVVYEYVMRPASDILIDREYLNDLFLSEPTLASVGVEAYDDPPKVVFSRTIAGRSDEMVAERRRHHEVHLIDIDTARGITPDERECFVYDVIKLVISASHWAELHGAGRVVSDLLATYFDQWQALRAELDR